MVVVSSVLSKEISRTVSPQCIREFTSLLAYERTLLSCTLPSLSWLFACLQPLWMDEGDLQWSFNLCFPSTKDADLWPCALLKAGCSIHLAIYCIEIIACVCLVFCTHPLLDVYLVNFSPFHRHFSGLIALPCRRFLISCRPTHQLLVMFPELLETFSESPCLFLRLKWFTPVWGRVGGGARPGRSAGGCQCLQHCC